MISKAIQRKISSGQVILYRRVSTKKQASGEYRHQLDSIKSMYPDFSIVQSTIDSITEDMSGRADAERRMASGLGKSLRQLKRHPHAILLVSNADRIARRTDVFTLIQEQGFGHCIYDATTGMCLNDLIRVGLHTTIEKQTKAQRASCIRGMVRHMNEVGDIGFSGIAKQSALGSSTKKRLTREREAEVLTIVSQVTSRKRGQTPSYGEICDELDRQEVRTGQKRFFTPVRLAQLRKKNPNKWIRSFDSYHRPRRRIRRTVTTSLVEHRKRRNREGYMKRLVIATTYKPIWANLNHPKWDNIASCRHHRCSQHSKTKCKRKFLNFQRRAVRKKYGCEKPIDIRMYRRR